MSDMNKIDCILSAQYCSPEMAAQMSFTVGKRRHKKVKLQDHERQT